MTGVRAAASVENHRPEGAVLEVHDWHTQCGACGYGRGGWAAGLASEGKPILTPESRTCHGCGAAFTHVSNSRTLAITVLPRQEAA